MPHPSIDVAFGDHFVAELVHIFIILRRHSGEELALTCDCDGQILSCFSDFGMDMLEDLEEEELQAIKKLANKRSIDYD